MNKLLRILKRRISTQDLIDTDNKLIESLVISDCGVDNDYPYIRLKSGEVFYSFYPSDRELRRFHRLRSSLPKNLKEETFRVALDIAQRFIRENSLGYIPPKSHYLYPGWHFLDLGSHIGYGAIKAARKVGAQGSVIAVEPNQEAYALLIRNIKANALENVTAVNAATGDVDGKVNLSVGGRQNNSIFPSIRDDISNSALQYDTVSTVSMCTVDTLVEKYDLELHDRPVHVSFEINGAEVSALRGAEKFLKNASGFVLRIAARYSSGSSGSAKEQIINLLNEHKEIAVRDLPPYIFAHKHF